MKRLLPLAWLALAASAAHALPSDVKTLAQFDLGYAKCEARFAHMRGQRDAAYLALWKAPANARQRDELARVRKSAAYKRERLAAQKALAPEDAQTERKIRQQCQATWGELQRSRQRKVNA